MCISCEHESRVSLTTPTPTLEHDGGFVFFFLVVCFCLSGKKHGTGT